MNKLLLISLIFVLTGTNSFAQRSPVSDDNKLYLGMGYGRTYFKDINYSPLNYQGNAFALELGYQKTVGEENILFTNIDFSYSILRTEASDYFDSPRILGGVEIGFLKKTDLFNGRGNLFYGGQYHTFGSVAHFDDGGGITYFGLHSLDVVLSLNYLLANGHSISTSFSLPVLGVLVRPVYTGWDKLVGEFLVNDNSFVKIATTGNWTSVNDYFVFDYNLNYQYPLSSKWDILAWSTVKYFKTEYLKLSKNVDFQFGIGAQLKF